MDDTKKMLQAIIHGQNALKQELINKIDKVDRKLTKRLDNIDGQLAYLEDDAPTRQEHDELAGRVEKLEQKATATV